MRWISTGQLDGFQLWIFQERHCIQLSNRREAGQVEAARETRMGVTGQGERNVERSEETKGDKQRERWKKGRRDSDSRETEIYNQIIN